MDARSFRHHYSKQPRMSARLVFIDGDQGTTGLQIHQRLRDRTDIKLFTLAAEERKVARRRAGASNTCDIAILCWPDAAAREAVNAIENPAIGVIDASSAHRPQPSGTYELPESTREQAARITNARRVPNPGCYPTGAIELLRPLSQAGLKPRSYPVSINAVSGYSGRGRAGVEEYEGREAAYAPPFQIYGLGLDHKHAPESRCTPTALPECLARHYAASAHVRVMSQNESSTLRYLDPQVPNGTNDMHLNVFHNEEKRASAAVRCLDHLGKGASGAAVQNLDLMLTRQ